LNFDISQLEEDAGVDHLINGDHCCVLHVMHTMHQAEAHLEHKAKAATKLTLGVRYATRCLCTVFFY
jgi:hypothetical protein